jgi:hypothetical protein
MKISLASKLTGLIVDDIPLLLARHDSGRRTESLFFVPPGDNARGVASNRFPVSRAR